MTHAVIGLAGDDTLAIRERLGAIRRAFADRSTGGDEIVVDGSSGDAAVVVSRVLEELRTRSFDGGDKLVIVQAADELTKKQRDALLAYADSPSSFAQLVLVTRSFGPGRNKLRDTLKKAGAYHAYARPSDTVAPWVRNRDASDTDLNRWVATRAREVGVRFAPGVIERLTRRVGNDLEEIDGLLARWRLLDVETVTADRVAGLGAVRRSADTFALADAVVERRLDEALETLHCLFEQGLTMGERRVRKPGDLLPLITAVLLKKFRLLFRVRERLAAGARPKQLVEELGVKSFLLDATVDGARRFRGHELAYGIERLLVADRRLKLEGGAPDAVLVELIVDLIRGRAPRTSDAAR